jgi:hypothetical protein
LELIFQTCGHPTPDVWPEVGKSCKLWNSFKPKDNDPVYPSRLREALKSHLPNPRWMTDSALDMIENLMVLDPEHRWSAEKALLADYFFDDPIAKDASQLSMRFSVESMHEWEHRRKHEQMMAARQSNAKDPIT